jgi:hypothetical protein
MSMLALRQRARRGLALRGVDWRSPGTVPRAVMVVLYTASALFAVAVASFTTNELHRLWGIFAACAYLLAAAAVLAWRARGSDLALLVSVGGALIMPLSLMAADHLHQPEVAVIDQSGSLLVHHGTPYLGAAALNAAHNPNIFDPYLPVLTAFGLPRAVSGVSVITDPRIWFGVCFVVLFAAALVIAGVKDVVRWTTLVTASPVIAFSLTVGGTDIPVLACMCLGLALMWRKPRPVLAGVALGAAAAMKATAWPALVVAAVLLLARDGKRPAAVMFGTALAVVAATVGPVAALWPRALVLNAIDFPLGLTREQSAAASPLPGHLLAATGTPGHKLALVLLALAGLGVGLSLLVRPPRSVPSATWLLVIGLSLMIVLAPNTRFGYFLYPVGLLAWLGISQLGGAATGATSGDGERGGRGSASSANSARQEAYQSANH